MVKITETHNPDEKSNICDNILRALPNWFGNEASIVDYVGKVRSIPFFTAFDNYNPVGFLAVKIHNIYTSEICVTGVLKDYHRQGIGRMLVERCVIFCEDNKNEFLTVKTLDNSAQSKSYDKTRAFYMSMGFRPLEIFPLYWDEENPCLFMAKKI
jgi:ribosomal protein S18 acetylase RimI-like enzyme